MLYAGICRYHTCGCCVTISTQQPDVPAYTGIYQMRCTAYKVAPDDGLTQSETCRACNGKIKSNHKNFVHLVGLYTYCRMMHDAYDAKQEHLVLVEWYQHVKTEELHEVRITPHVVHQKSHTECTGALHRPLLWKPEANRTNINFQVLNYIFYKMALVPGNRISHVNRKTVCNLQIFCYNIAVAVWYSASVTLPEINTISHIFQLCTV